MPLLDIIKLPNPNLKKVAEPISKFDQTLQQLGEDMLETMYQASGIGLAATQVDVHRRIVVVDVSEDKDQPLVLVNPVITEKSGEQTHEEGCLSIPGINAKVKRAAQISLDYQDVAGQPHQLQADELLAVCIQHEIDHINGILFIDHLSALKRKMLLKKYNGKWPALNQYRQYAWSGNVQATAEIKTQPQFTGLPLRNNQKAAPSGYAK